MFDTMRGWTNPANNARLFANLSNAETAGDGQAYPTATGFGSAGLAASTTYIYIAIRRGPMRTPTSGTQVYNAITRIGTTSAATITGAGFPPDFVGVDHRNGGGYAMATYDKLRGATIVLRSNSTAADWTVSDSLTSFNQDGFSVGADVANNIVNGSTSLNLINWMFRRAPGFFDVVCFTQTTTTAAQTISHNLTVTPELVIAKPRSAVSDWQAFPIALNNRLNLNTTLAASTYAPLSSVTSTSFSYPMADLGVSIGTTFVAYLFATCPGVSKVGSYTGTGTTKQIDCGFAAGARFVLIKRTDSTGDWYVWDSARGIVAGNDPYLLLNSTAAEVTNTDYVDTYSAGFEISSTAPAAINANGGTFIFLAIA